MEYENFGALDASITAKLDSDTDFQSTLTDLSDEDKETAVKTRKSELLDEEIKTLSLGSKKDKELADNYKKRAEKAEADLKKGKKPAEGGDTTETPVLAQKDLIVLINAQVSEEDIDDVVEYATFKKISISDALKSSTVKSILAEKAEIRKTAQATSTGNQRRGTTKVSDETLLANAKKGELPEAGSPEAEQLFWARRKKNK